MNSNSINPNNESQVFQSNTNSRIQPTAMNYNSNNKRNYQVELTKSVQQSPRNFTANSFNQWQPQVELRIQFNTQKRSSLNYVSRIHGFKSIDPK
ncbi:hypothetical protein A4A49_36846 [Nicotiana attenuata]|uniref:Uncharacterized protein n=1 Tax=Nicotiana attenuata TaxID=49451 RepID=A0A314LAV0_NICAT|nr:hypothetical protein A4A49_36846 [Nicotiana attenuata]